MPANDAQTALLLPSEEWPSGLEGVLGELGCLVVDTAAFELPVGVLVAGGYVQKGDGKGLLAALRAALSGSGNRGSSSGSGRVTADSSSSSIVDGPGAVLDVRPFGWLSAAQRRLLRAYLLQERWFAGQGAAVQQPVVRTLQQLPLYEVAATVAAAATAAAAGAHGGAAVEAMTSELARGGGATDEQRQHRQQQQGQQQQQQQEQELQQGPNGAVQAATGVNGAQTAMEPTFVALQSGTSCLAPAGEWLLWLSIFMLVVHIANMLTLAACEVLSVHQVCTACVCIKTAT